MNDMEAFMLLVTDSRHDFEVLESLKGLPQALEVHRIYGEYDMLVRFRVNDPEELSSLERELLNGGQILSIDTLVITGE
ncbi:MAG TPA: Lrp/AsnC family transcriptional regulator [Thermococcus sp.]|nr:Lrp/AsnC family transcriptional regulator [Thermococcus sp.]